MAVKNNSLTHRYKITLKSTLLLKQIAGHICDITMYVNTGCESVFNERISRPPQCTCPRHPCSDPRRLSLSSISSVVAWGRSLQNQFALLQHCSEPVRQFPPSLYLFSWLLFLPRHPWWAQGNRAPHSPHYPISQSVWFNDWDSFPHTSSAVRKTSYKLRRAIHFPSYSESHLEIPSTLTFHFGSCT